MLAAAGVAAEDVTAFTAVTRRDGHGSRAEAMFRTEQALQSAKMRVWHVRRSYIDSKYVWLDVKKTRSELAPARARGPQGRGSDKDAGNAAALQTVVGVHGAFEDLAAESHANIARLAKRRPRPGPLAVVGDFNVNMLDSPAPDDVSQVSGHAHARARAEEKEEAREALRTLASSIGLRIRTPNSTVRGPGGGEF